jgi:hypothetical protein
VNIFIEKNVKVCVGVGGCVCVTQLIDMSANPEEKVKFAQFLKA